MSQTMILSVLIMARDLASPVLRALGMTGVGSINPVTAAAIALGTAIVGVGVESVKLASGFETQFARITGLTGTSAAMAEWYKKRILDLSPAWDMSATDAAKALYFIISAGFQGKAAIDVLNYSAKSATASLADQATVADALTSMMNAYKDANIGASQAANDLTRIEVFGKATLSSFASSLGFTMTTAHAAGIGIDEASAAIATLSQVSGQHGIRRMSMEFDNLARSLLDINAVAKRAKAEGLNFDKNYFSTLTFIGKLQYLQHITGALTSNINDQTYAQMVNMDATKNQLAATAALDKELDISNSNFMKLTGGAAAFIPSVVLLSGKASMYNSILAQMATHTDIVTSAFNNMRQTTAQQWKMLEIRLQNVAIVIGMQLLPYVKMLLTALMGGAEVLLKWMQAPGHFALIASAVKGLAIVVGAMLIPVLIDAVIAAAPFVAALAALVVVSILVGKAFEALTSKWHSVQAFLRDASPLALALKAVLITVAIVIGVELVAAFYSMAAAAWTAAGGVLAATWPLVLLIAIIAAVVFAVLELVTHWKQVTGFLLAIWNTILGAAKAIWGAIAGFFSEQWRKLVAGFQLAWQMILEFLAGIWQAIVGAAKQFVSDILGAFLWLYNHNWYFKALVDSIVKVFRWLATAAIVIWNTLKSWLVGVWTTIVTYAVVIWKTFLTGLMQVLTAVKNFFVGIWTAVSSWLVGVWRKIVAEAKGKWQEFYNTILAPIVRLWSSISGWLSGLGKNIAGWFGNLASQAVKWGENFINMLVQGIKNSAGHLWGQITGIAGGIAKVLGFHSPPPEGPLRDSASYFPNMLRLFQTSMLANLPALLAATKHVASSVASSFTPSALAPRFTPSLAAAGTAASSASTGLLPTSAAGETHIHLNFPGVKSSDEIRKAFDDLMRAHERANYRTARQAGYGRGLRAGV